MKSYRKSTSRWGIQAPRATPGMCGGEPLQDTTRPEGHGPLLAAQVLVRRSAPSTCTTLEERNGRKHWKTKGQEGTMVPSCKAGQCATPAVYAVRGAQASSPDPHSGTHCSHSPRMRKKLLKSSAFYRSSTDVSFSFQRTVAHRLISKCECFAIGDQMMSRCLFFEAQLYSVLCRVLYR